MGGPILPWSAGSWVLVGALVAAALLAAPVVPHAPEAALAVLVAWIAAQDLRSFTIPDAALAGWAALAVFDLTTRPLFAIDPAFAAGAFVLEGLVCGGSVLLVREIYYRRQGHDGIGFGDVKLAGVGGLLCGLAGFSLALLIASLAGLAVALIQRRVRPGRASGKVAFGACLAPAFLLVWLSGASL
ncbi:prepilin peptidase [Aureimonas sp. AU12]|uniref:prepilin peptidase n=1 Tax=Aureimonas sp. AU12 TaxID=1638161 RepID=UPI000782618E|nr:prepilin peptidase [Aureimonas sp. AU12]